MIPFRHCRSFSIRTLLLSVTIIAAPLAWVGYSLNWIRERRDFRDRHIALEFPTVFRGSSLFDQEEYHPQAPGSLWIFGEHGQPGFMLKDANQTEWAQRLFPEAVIDQPQETISLGM